MGTPLHCLLVEDDEADALLILRPLKLGGFDVTPTRVDTADAMKAALHLHEWDVIEGYDLGATNIRKPVDFGQFVEAVANLGVYWLVLNEPLPRPGR